MTHPRKQIRDAVVAALIGATGAGSSVYSNRMLPYFDTELPSLNVISDTETDEVLTESPQELRRSLDLKIEVRLEALEATDDALDTIAEQIEQAIGLEFFVTTPRFGFDFVSHLYLRATTFQISIEGERTVGLMTLTYDIRYATTTPLTAASGLDNLDIVEVEYETNDNVVAVDIVNGLQD